jgi:hypothetical protein
MAASALPLTLENFPPGSIAETIRSRFVGATMHPEPVDSDISDAVIRQALEPFGVFCGSRFPMLSPYVGDAACCAWIGGSHLYSIDDAGSDFDIHLVSVKRTTIRYFGPTGAFTRPYTLGELAFLCMTGRRHAWEILTAPSRLLLRSEERTTEALAWLRTKMKKSFDPASFAASSSAYFDTWYPHVQMGMESPDMNVRRWTQVKGWPYKIGYYLYLDAVLMSKATQTGWFNPGAMSVAEAATAVKLKRGEMLMTEWREAILPFLQEKSRKRIGVITR